MYARRLVAGHVRVRNVGRVAGRPDGHLVTVTAPEIAVVYTDDPEWLAETVRLRPTRTDGNVVTTIPYDPIVFERIREQGEIRFASIAQVAIDCLTGFGRMPAEGEALLDWMRQRAPRWQSAALAELPELP